MDAADIEDINTFFLLCGAALVFFMQAGFAMLEVGSVNVLNLQLATATVLLKNIMDAAIGALCWWATGFGLAYGDSPSGFAGTTQFGLDERYFEERGVAGSSGYMYAKWIFSWTFAATSTTILSGAVAERCTAFSYVTYTIFCISVVYPLVACWAWNPNGWLSAKRDHEALLGCGVVDFAGSGVVHLLGGTAALVGASMVGPRQSFANGSLQTPMYGPIFQTLGTLILWFGWFGFNAFSHGSLIGSSQIAGRAACNTALAGATGGLVAGFLGNYLEVKDADKLNKTMKSKKPEEPGGEAGKFNSTTGRNYEASLFWSNNGVLAGLVGITAGCATARPIGAFVGAICSAVVYVVGSRYIKRTGIDDVVDATAIHGFCGALGVLLAALFTTPENYLQVYGSSKGRADKCAGVFYGGDGTSLATALIFVLVVVAWTTLSVGFIFHVLRSFYVLRIPIAIEESGLEESQNGRHFLVEMGSNKTIGGPNMSPPGSFDNMAQIIAAPAPAIGRQVPAV